MISIKRNPITFLYVLWGKNDLHINENSVPSTFTLEKPFLLQPSMIELLIVVRVLPLDFLDTVDKNITEEVEEINIIFTSDFKDMTFSHYMAQPRSMVCRKLVRNFFEEDFGKFDYKWLLNCFRHINT